MIPTKNRIGTTEFNGAIEFETISPNLVLSKKKIVKKLLTEYLFYYLINKQYKQADSTLKNLTPKNIHI